MIRTIVYWGLNWGPLILGNYQIRPVVLSSLNPKPTHQVQEWDPVVLDPPTRGLCCHACDVHCYSHHCTADAMQLALVCRSLVTFHRCDYSS